MRTTISVSLNKAGVTKIKKLAVRRGFHTASDYLRFLLEQDDVDLISESELIARSKEADNMHRSNKLVRAKSLSEFLD
ncbi:hypothetical protein A3I40_01245 [Candidatus Uhrbacteria bacterium RIFCSPLOWO2_02_FULL_48_12]|uniref:Uncharacterized protein n=1 Tax=Candidatus Uhrbacteria bacterium RIFCSPLOWO2_02_FULL_48_12 TaxID=1802407 RepID=A0A1F7V9K0_9BACT|nr:MAG: hypothetical protein A3I40_01245 [Candidatus Uhrbacteria bacterium RIFCSPLOWO2_02_FULL_48_12]